MVLHILLILLALFGGFILSFFLWIGISSLFISMEKEYDSLSPYYRFILDVTAVLCCFFLRIKIVLDGEEKLPSDSHYLFVSNHRSAFDPVVACAALRKQKLIFVSKPENFKIPIFGPVAHRCGFLPIDRDNPRNAVSTIRKASAIIDSGVSPIGIYPEGTRTKNGDLLPLHNAVFKIAQGSKVPIVVSTVTGTEQIRKRTPFRRTIVHLQILEVLSADFVTASKTNIIGERVSSIMQESLCTTGNEKASSNQ